MAEQHIGSQLANRKQSSAFLHPCATDPAQSIKLALPTCPSEEDEQLPAVSAGTRSAAELAPQCTAANVSSGVAGGDCSLSKGEDSRPALRAPAARQTEESMVSMVTDSKRVAPS